MIILDTTVLVYAKGADHPFRDPCRRLISLIADGTLAATTTVEVIQEFAHVRARRRDRADAAALALDYLQILEPLALVTAEDLSRGLALFERVEQLGAFDAVLAATAARQAAALVSADGAFAFAPDIAHVTPDAAGIDRLLAH
jgi:predicted nucleic acid-binding protein